MRIPNKVLASMVFAWGIGFFYLIYLYFFVYFTSTLTLISNVDDFKVQLYAKEVAGKFERSCKEKTCTLNDISPFIYVLTVTKEGYEAYSTTVDLKWAVKKEETIQLKKVISLQDIQKKEVTKEEKVDMIKLKARAIYIEKVDDVWIMYFTQGEKFDLYLSTGLWSDVLIGAFNKYPKEDISITKVLTSTGQVCISLGKETFIYDAVDDILASIELRVPVKYAKYDAFSKKYQLITANGTFVVDGATFQVTFAPIFQDYITVSPNEVIGILSKTDEQRRKNFAVPETYKDSTVLLKYSQDTLQKEVIFSTSKQIEKIYQEGKQIFIEDGEGAKSQVTWVID